MAKAPGKDKEKSADKPAGILAGKLAGKPAGKPVGKPADKGKRLLLGIDLGTSRTAVMSSRGEKHMVRSVVGYPRDLIGVKLLGSPYVVGQEALDKRSYLDIRYPLEDGVLREYSERDIEVARHLLSHVIEVAKPKPNEEICAIIGVPARASGANKSLLLNIAQEMMDMALVISEPFMVAYGQGKLVNALVIDIGAGTVDLSALKGTLPEAEDQATLTRAGNFVDERLMALIEERYPEVQINTHVTCAIKEENSFVGDNGKSIKVELRADGKPGTYDVTDQVQAACESLVPEIIETAENLIRSFPPEHQSDVLKNIVMAGGGSRIKGLASFIAEKLSTFGEVQVTTVADSTFDGSAGALKLAQELPPDYWDQLGDLIA